MDPSQQPYPPTMPERLPEGVVVGRHRIESVLREGGMATIYLGRHVETNARVAIKILHTEYVRQPDFIARFDREASVMGRLSGCPQIVSVHDVGSLPDGRRYLVMEFVRGHDLQDELDQVRSNDQCIEVARAVSIMRDVAAGLAVAHHMEVVHRDIKPSNIMLELSAGRELAKLVDFGVSADLAESGRQQDLTAGGTVIGTARYMAPEQAAGISDVATVDIWAMGVVLIEMLSGVVPPDKGWGLRGVDLSTLPPTLPPDLRALIEHMVQPDSTLRLQSAAEAERRFIEILTRFGAGISLVASIDPSLVVPGGARTALVAPPATGPMAPARATPAKGSGVNPLLLGALTAMILVVAGLGTWFALYGRALLEGRGDNAAEAVVSTSEDAAATDDQASAKVAKTPAAEPPATPPDLGAENDDAQLPPPSEVEPDQDADGDDSDGDVLEIPDEPEPDAPRAAGKKKKKPRPATPPAAGTPAKAAEGCDAQRDAAEEANTAKRWGDVLSNTKKKSCWKTKTSRRQRLRVRALHGQGQFDKCAKEGSSSGDPIVLGLVNRCRDAAG